MQHRNTYQPPNTPSFSIEESTSDSLSTPPPTSASFIPSSSLPSSNGNGESSYFMNNDKQLLPSSSNNPYPPPHSSRSPTRTHFTPPTNSSVHLPLLHDQEPTSSSPNSSLEDPIPIHSRRHFSNPQSSNASSIPIHHTRSNSNKGGGGGAAGNWLRSLIVTRTRLHPLVLVPVFLFGVICAATFGGGGGNGRESLGRSAMSSLKVRRLFNSCEINLGPSSSFEEKTKADFAILQGCTELEEWIILCPSLSLHAPFLRSLVPLPFFSPLFLLHHLPTHLLLNPTSNSRPNSQRDPLMGIQTLPTIDHLGTSRERIQTTLQRSETSERFR